MATAILMYHAVTGEGGQPPAENYDAHYAVTASSFSRHLALIQQSGLVIRSVESQVDHQDSVAAACITFDDGAASDAEIATPVLLRMKATADFFVNTSNIGKPGFASWLALRDMATAGMSIQSHGHTHRLLDDLQDADIGDELQRSKALLEDGLGKSVTLFAPPGGRLPARAVQIATAAGYRRICGSAPGAWSGAGQFVLPRLAVLASTTDATIQSWAEADPATLLRLRATYGARYVAKKILGNGPYQRIRAKLLGNGAKRDVGR